MALNCQSFDNSQSCTKSKCVWASKQCVCPVDYYLTPQKLCVQCPDNSHSAGKDQTSCVCKVNYYEDEKRPNTCQSCGKHQTTKYRLLDGVGLSQQEACFCEMGRYSLEENKCDGICPAQTTTSEYQKINQVFKKSSEVCTICNNGWYSLKQERLLCTGKCPENTICADQSKKYNGIEEACTMCDYKNGLSGSIEECEQCKPGYYPDQKDFLLRCSQFCPSNQNQINNFKLENGIYNMGCEYRYHSTATGVAISFFAILFPLIAVILAIIFCASVVKKFKQLEKQEQQDNLLVETK